MSAPMSAELKGELIRLDHRPVPEGAEVRAFLVVRDHAAMLPWLLEHHRTLGVNRFFVVDNGSHDGSVDWLLAQPDCHVFSAAGSFAGARYGLDWKGELLDRFGEGRWCLSLDADELFVFPGCEGETLGALTARLDREGAGGVFAFMLDMYSRGSVAEAVYTPGRPFFEVCPYFDRDYAFRRPLVPLRGFPGVEVMGGPRLRLFFPEYHRVGRLRWLTARVRRRLGRAVALPPLLGKIPLVRWRGGMRYVSSHRTTPVRLSATTGVLLHFKFFADFHERVVREVARKEHYDGASEYQRYRRCLDADPALSFHYPGSVRYDGPQRLAALGLMGDEMLGPRTRLNF
jgi:hypothetical protein